MACLQQLPSLCAAQSSAAAARPASSAVAGPASASASSSLRLPARLPAGRRAGAVRPVAAMGGAVAQAGKAAEVPPLSATKAAFVTAYRYPISPLYNTVLQELLSQQHLLRYNVNYAYEPLAATGFVAVYDQLMEGFEPAADREVIFKAYINALSESPEAYRADAARLLAAAPGLGAAGLAALPEVQALAARKASGKLAYSKFVAIGLFSLLDAAGGVADKSSLETLVAAAGMDAAVVNRDLSVYKSMLSKLSAARELMNETLERERRKTAEREAKKAANASAAV